MQDGQFKGGFQNPNEFLIKRLGADRLRAFQDASVSAQKLGEEAIDFSFYAGAGKLSALANRSDIEVLKLAVGERLPRFKRFPEDEAVDIPGEEIFKALCIGLLEGALYQRISVRALAVRPVGELDFTCQDGPARLSVKCQVPAFAFAGYTFLNFSLRKGQSRILRQNPLDRLANVRRECPLVNFLRHWARRKAYWSGRANPAAVDSNRNSTAQARAAVCAGREVDGNPLDSDARTFI